MLAWIALLVVALFVEPFGAWSSAASALPLSQAGDELPIETVTSADEVAAPERLSELNRAGGQRAPRAHALPPRSTAFWTRSASLPLATRITLRAIARTPAPLPMRC